MSKKIIAGIDSNPVDILSLVRKPNNGKVMLCFNNDSADDGVLLEQTFRATAGGNDKVVVSRLGRGKCLTLMHTDDATILNGFESVEINIRTRTSDSKITLLLGDSTYIPEKSASYDIETENDILVYFLNLVQSTDYTLRVTVDKKQEVYLKALTDKSQATQFAGCDALEGEKITDLKMIPNSYRMYSIASRGFRCRDFVGTPSSTASQNPQGYSTDFDFNGIDSSSGAITNSEVRLYEIPYKPTSSTTGIRSFLSQYDNAKSGNGIDVSTGFSPDYNAMFLYEPSIWLNSKIRPINFTGESGVTNIGAITNNSVELDDPDEVNNLKKSTPMLKVTQDSECYFAVTSYSNDKIKSFAVDIQTILKSYPYSIAFSSPIMAGITFMSDTEIRVHLKDRTTVFTFDHFNKLLRFVAAYDAINTKLWVNGQEITLDSQSTLPVTQDITKIGLDVKDAGITAADYSKPTDNALNVGNLVLFSSVLNQSQVSLDFEYAKVWRDFEGQPLLTSNLINDLSQIDYWENQVKAP